MSAFASSESFDSGVRQLRTQNPRFGASYEMASRTIDDWLAQGLLTAEMIKGKRILDWECGVGGFAACFLERGADAVVGIDSWLDPAHARNLTAALPGCSFAATPIGKYLESAPERFDLVFANTVTEHLPDLAAGFRDCRSALSDSGMLFLNHDNYYQPTGAHDHGFLFYGDQGSVVFQGERCWESPDRCQASKMHRASVRDRFPWSWNDALEALCDPVDCDACPYYRRAQPWAHLLYQDDFQRIFPDVAYSTGREKSTLNKLSLFQLRQWLVEAGFRIESWNPVFVRNLPPRVLLEEPFDFSPRELCTATVAVRASKTPSDAYELRRGEVGQPQAAAPYPASVPSRDSDPVLELARRTLNGRALLRLTAQKLRDRVLGRNRN